jgi:hypothetical protein
MGTGFHEEFRDDPKIAGRLSDAWIRPLWCHDGSV